MTTITRRLTLMAHGDAGTGKSWLFRTAPGPRLLFDAEGRAEHLKGPIVYWDPRHPLPTVMADGVTPIDTDTTVVIEVRIFDDMLQGKKWIDSGAHYFRSVGLDSVTEAQDRLVENVRGSGTFLEQQQWGQVFDKMNDFVLAMKDWRRHPIKPIDVIYVSAGTDERAGKLRPYVRGQLGKKLPYRFDVVGYLTRQIDPTSNARYHDMLIDSAGMPIEAKSNIDDLSLAWPGGHIVNPDLGVILGVLNPPQEATAT